MFGQIEWNCFDNSTTKLYHDDLDDNGENGDEDEEFVVKNSGEDVEIFFSKLLHIDLIENLHEHKDIEHVGEMDTFLGHIPIFEKIWW